MFICNNPNCNKKTTNGLAYCSEDCLRQHQNQKSSNITRDPEITDIEDIIEYLDLDLENLNLGTKNKKRLTVRALDYMKKWKTGTYKQWIDRLSLRLNVTTRTVRENYVDPLISEGIIKRTGSQLVFNGIPNKDV